MLMIIQMKTKHNTILIGDTFQIIHRIIAASGSGKTNALLNLINKQPDIDKNICMLKILMNQNINF